MPDPATPPAAPGVWVDPYPAFNFKVKRPSGELAHFFEFSGLDIQVETYEYREAGQAQVVHQIPTIVKHHNITFKYGVTSTTAMWSWFMDTVKGRPRREQVTVFLLDSDGATTRMQWAFNGAYPVRFKGPRLVATAREIAIEEIELAYESIEPITVVA